MGDCFGCQLFLLADRKATLSFEATGEAVDVESDVYCWRRSGNFWRMRASLGLACAQAATLCAQVVGQPRSRPRAVRPRAWHHRPVLGLCLSLRMQLSLLFSVSVFFLLVLVALKLQSVVTGELPVVTVVLPVVTGEFLVLTGYQPVVTTNHRISGNRRETLVGIKKTARRQKRGG